MYNVMNIVKVGMHLSYARFKGVKFNAISLTLHYPKGLKYSIGEGKKEGRND